MVDRVADRLRHILDAIAAIDRLTARKDFADYRRDPDLAAAVERYIERLSEASRHLPDAYKRDYPNIDWRGASDIGNVLRHAYEQVIDEEIWSIVRNDLPPLKAAAEAMLAQHAKHPTNR